MRKFLQLAFFLVSPVFADESVSEFVSGAVEAQNYNYWGEFVNMLLTLAFILVLILASVWFLKKIMRSRIQNLNKSNGIKILERRPLTPKASLYLVDILGKGVVISESPAGIQLITEFSETINVEELTQQIQEDRKPRISFKEVLGKKLRKLTSKNA